MPTDNKSLILPRLPAAYVVGDTGPIIIEVGRFTLEYSIRFQPVLPIDINVGRFVLSSTLNAEDHDYFPDIFTGIAITHKKPNEYNDFIECERCTVYRRKPDGSFIVWDEIEPLTNNISRVCAFNPGGRFLCIGGNSINSNGISTRLKMRYPSVEQGFFNRDAFGYVPNISWSTNGKYFVAGINYAGSKRPMIVFWREGAYNEYQRDLSSSGITSREGFLYAEVSKLANYLAISSDSGLEIYRINHEDKGSYPSYTAVDVDPTGGSFYNVIMSWSPDDVHLCARNYIFKYDDIAEEFSIVTTLSNPGEANVRPEWSPCGTYLAVADDEDVNIYKRSGDSYSHVDTVSMASSDHVRSICWSKCGNHVFIGGATASPNAFYQFDRSGDSFSQNTATDWSDVKTDVTSITYAPDPFVESIGKFQTENSLLFDDYYKGLFCDAGRLQIETALKLDDIDLISNEISVNIGRFSETDVLKTPSAQLSALIGRLETQNALHGHYQITTIDGLSVTITAKKPTVSAGSFFYGVVTAHKPAVFASVTSGITCNITAHKPQVNYPGRNRIEAHRPEVNASFAEVLLPQISSSLIAHKPGIESSCLHEGVLSASLQCHRALVSSVLISSNFIVAEFDAKKPGVVSSAFEDDILIDAYIDLKKVKVSSWCVSDFDDYIIQYINPRSVGDGGSSPGGPGYLLGE